MLVSILKGLIYLFERWNYGERGRKRRRGKREREEREEREQMNFLSVCKARAGGRPRPKPWNSILISCEGSRAHIFRISSLAFPDTLTCSCITSGQTSSEICAHMGCWQPGSNLICFLGMKHCLWAFISSYTLLG